ncbi:MAG: hydroxyisourate hydrolase [Pseudomonadota bacterium]
MGRLTTHVLDTARGRPAEGLRLELFRLAVDSRDRIAETRTNADGRCDAPLLTGTSFRTGIYEIVFHAGEWLDAQALDLPVPKFLGAVPIRFGIAEPEGHYHVPLLLSPYGYSTYRGS